jgi:hypothetical protein
LRGAGGRRPGGCFWWATRCGGGFCGRGSVYRPDPATTLEKPLDCSGEDINLIASFTGVECSAQPWTMRTSVQFSGLYCMCCVPLFGFQPRECVSGRCVDLLRSSDCRMVYMCDADFDHASKNKSGDRTSTLLRPNVTGQKRLRLPQFLGHRCIPPVRQSQV